MVTNTIPQDDTVNIEPVSSDAMDQLKSDVNNDPADKDNWGLAVCFGTIITFVAGIGHVNSFAIIYKDFVIESHSTAKSMASAHGIFAIMLAVGGIFLNIITAKTQSFLSGGYIGAAIFIIGSFSTVFITNTNQLSLTYGFLQGVGFGIMVPVCYSTLNKYFVTKRTAVMSICKAIQGIITMWYPQVLKEIMYLYGFRGTLLIISGISLHVIPGMLVMKTHDETQRRNHKAANIESGDKDNEDNGLLVQQDDSKGINNEQLKRNKSSEISAKLLEILKVRILRDPIYCNIIIGQSFVNFSDLTFFIFQPFLLLQYGFDVTDIATCISICTAADVAGRFCLAVASSFFKINTRSLFYIATFLTFGIRLVILQCRQFTWVAILTAVLGFLRAQLHVASPLVISNHFSHTDFPGAYALFMLCAGIINAFVAPFIGLLRDTYQDYEPAFYALTLCCLPCLLLWPLECIKKGK